MNNMGGKDNQTKSLVKTIAEIFPSRTKSSNV